MHNNENIQDPFSVIDWKPGDIFLDEYRVIRMLGRGGIGRVYLVETVSPPTLKYAVKILKKALLIRKNTNRILLKELQTWIDLPIHTNIISCRFVKTVDGRLAIFSEYAEAGSLKTWIRSRRVATLEQILDCSIQIAWGLETAHKNGVIHLDVKPDNVLMTRDQTAKLTDFGISIIVDPANQVTNRNSTSAMTPAYASPEQASGKSVTCQSDIWSFAVTILEMFIGRVTWRYGFHAAQALEEYCQSGSNRDGIAIPESIQAILRKCLSEDNNLKYINMQEVTRDLQFAWVHEFNRPYNRRKPVLESRTAKSSNQKPRISVEEWFKIVTTDLKINPSEYKGPKPSNLNTPDAQRFADLEVLDGLIKLYEKTETKTNNNHPANIIQLIMDKAHIHESLRDYPGAIHHFDLALEKCQKIKGFNENFSLKKIYSANLGNKANLLYLSGKFNEALIWHKKNIELLEKISQGETSSLWFNQCARHLYNYAITCFALKDYEKASNLTLQCIRLREKLVFHHNRLEFIDALTQSYSNIAFIYHVAEQFQSALSYYDKSIALIEQSSSRSDTLKYARQVALISLGKAMTLRRMNQPDDSVKMFEAAIKINQSLHEQYKNLFDYQQLAITYINKGNFHRNLNDYQDAQEAYDNGIKVIENIVSDKGCGEFRVFLAKSYANRAILYLMKEQFSFFSYEIHQTLRLFLSLIFELKQQDILPEFVSSLNSLAQHFDQEKWHKIKAFLNTKSTGLATLHKTTENLLVEFGKHLETTDNHEILDFLDKLRKYCFRSE